jgi:DNA-binding CsgD family transcriptional regulator
MADLPQETESRSRQEQILMLASEGLTDKEIAARLKLSPETVGTYWRRILSKYAAASRTEVVAKVVRLQAEAEVGHLTQVSEGLREVADHLLVVLRDQRLDPLDGATKISESLDILESIPDLIIALDSEGFTSYSNRATDATVEAGEPFEWALDVADREPFRECFAKVLSGGTTASLQISLSNEKGGASRYHALLSLRESGGAVMSLRLEG